MCIRDRIKKKQEALEDELKKAKSDKESKIEAKILMEEQLQSTKDEISALNKVLYQLEDKLEKKNSELDKASKNYNEYMEKFKSRARASYEAGDISYIEVLLCLLYTSRCV